MGPRKESASSGRIISLKRKQRVEGSDKVSGVKAEGEGRDRRVEEKQDLYETAKGLLRSQEAGKTVNGKNLWKGNEVCKRISKRESLKDDSGSEIAY